MVEKIGQIEPLKRADTFISDLFDLIGLIGLLKWQFLSVFQKIPFCRGFMIETSVFNAKFHNLNLENIQYLMIYKRNFEN